LFYNFVKNVLHYPNDYLDRVFQYPYGMGHNSGIIRHARGHRNHLHLRFYSPLAVANARQQRFDNPQMAELQDLMIQYETRLTATPASFAPARGERAYLGTGGKRLIHTVRTGDTLWSIAKQYGATVSQIRAWNHMSSKDRLRVGQKLNVFQQKPKTDDQTG
jgi:LysM repeat protein